jgi:hypothetical protein
MIVSDNDFWLESFQSLDFLQAIEQRLHHPGTVSRWNDDAELYRHDVNPLSLE